MSHESKIVHQEKVDKILSQFEDSPIIKSIIESMLLECDAVEDMFHQLLDERMLLIAIGSQLDVIGSLVGEARDNRLDEEYRQAIFTRIAINTSTATINDLLDISKIYSGSNRSRLWEHPSASAQYSVFVNQATNTPGLLDTFETASPAGVSLVHIFYSNSDDALTPAEDGIESLSGVLPEDDETQDIYIPCEIL